MKRSKDTLNDHWDSIKWNDICIPGDREKKNRGRDRKVIRKKKVAENFPALKKETDIQVQEFQSSK